MTMNDLRLYSNRFLPAQWRVLRVVCVCFFALLNASTQQPWHPFGWSGLGLALRASHKPYTRSVTMGFLESNISWQLPGRWRSHWSGGFLRSKAEAGFMAVHGSTGFSIVQLIPTWCIHLDVRNLSHSFSFQSLFYFMTKHDDQHVAGKYHHGGLATVASTTVLH